MLRCAKPGSAKPPPLLACPSPRCVIAVGRPERDAGTWRTRIAEARRDRARHPRARRHVSRGAARRMVDSSVSLAGLGAALDHRRRRRGQPPARKSTAVPAFEPAPVAARFLDAVRTGHGTEGPHRDRVRRPDGRRVGRRGAAGLARRPDQRFVGRRGPPPDDLPDGALAPRYALHRHDRRQRPLRGRRQARRPDAQRRAYRGRRHGSRSRPRGRSAIGSVPTRRSRSSSIGPSRSRPFARRFARHPRSTVTCSWAPTSGEFVFTPWSTLSPRREVPDLA